MGNNILVCVYKYFIIGEYSFMYGKYFSKIIRLVFFKFSIQVNIDLYVFFYIEDYDILELFVYKLNFIVFKKYFS